MRDAKPNSRPGQKPPDRRGQWRCQWYVSAKGTPDVNAKRTVPTCGKACKKWIFYRADQLYTRVAKIGEKCPRTKPARPPRPGAIRISPRVRVLNTRSGLPLKDHGILSCALTGECLCGRAYESHFDSLA